MLLMVFKAEENQDTNAKIRIDGKIRSVYWSTEKNCVCLHMRTNVGSWADSQTG